MVYRDFEDKMLDFIWETASMNKDIPLETDPICNSTSCSCHTISAHGEEHLCKCAEKKNQ